MAEKTIDKSKEEIIIEESSKKSSNKSIEKDEEKLKLIMVVGPGAIGTFTAVNLDQNNANVEVLGRAHHQTFFNDHTMKLSTTDASFESNIPIITIDDLKSKTKLFPDYVLITLKGTTTLAVVEDLAKIIPSKTPIISLQNGFIAKHIFEKSPFTNVFPCVVGFNVALESLGKVRQTSAGDLTIGKLSEDSTTSTDQVPKEIVKMLTKIAPVKISKNIMGDVWMKAMINSTINPICGIGNFPLGGLVQSKATIALATWIWRELVDVTVAMNIHVEPFNGVLYPEMIYSYDIVQFGIARTIIGKIAYPHREAIVSMLQDIRNKRRTEIEYLNGEIYSLGKKYNVPMPVNERIIEMVHIIEEGKKKPSIGLINKLYRDIILKVK
ncbi:MAG: ketopantoate reductase family protein [Promethearchaeota archaeon]